MPVPPGQNTIQARTAAVGGARAADREQHDGDADEQSPAARAVTFMAHVPATPVPGSRTPP